VTVSVTGVERRGIPQALSIAVKMTL